MTPEEIDAFVADAKTATDGVLLSQFKLGDHVLALAAECRRLRAQNTALQNKLIEAATVLPDLMWRHERDAARRMADALHLENEQFRAQVEELTSERDALIYEGMTEFGFEP